MFNIGNPGIVAERNIGDFCIEALTKYVKPEFVKEALIETRRLSRRVRKLPAEATMWFLVAAGLFKEESLQDVLSKVGMPPGGRNLWDKSPSSTAFSKARERLGVEPMQALFGKVAGHLLETFGGEMRKWGMLVTTLDGVTLKVPDSEANREYFGAPGQNRGRTGYPQMRALFECSATHHFVLHGALAPYKVGEVTLARLLLSRLGAGRLLLMDRNFGAYELLSQVLESGSQFIVRLKKNAKTERIKKIGEGDWLALLRPNRKLAGQCPGLRDCILVREIEREIPGKGLLRLAASLTDAEQYDGDKIAQTYAMRWEAEGVHDEIKTHQCNATTTNRPLICRTKTPSRVMQEVLGMLIAYNATRAIMAEAAQTAEQSPLRIGFISSLRRIRLTVIKMIEARTEMLAWLYESMLERIATLKLPPRRRRTNPRAVKIKCSPYLVKRSKCHVA